MAGFVIFSTFGADCTTQTLIQIRMIRFEMLNYIEIFFAHFGKIQPFDVNESQ